MQTTSRICAKALRGAIAAFSLFSVVAIPSLAGAQIPPTLDPSKRVNYLINFTVDGSPASGTHLAECGADIGLLGLYDQQQGPPGIYWTRWSNVTTNEEHLTGPQDLTINHVEGTNQYRFVVYEEISGSWDEAFLTINTQDTTAPNLTLVGGLIKFISCGSQYLESGWIVNDSCDSSVPVIVTSNLDVNMVGTYQITYTATDDALNETVAVRTVRVVYSWSGLLQPVDQSGQSVFKRGSTVPLKFQLTGNCADVTNLEAKVYLAFVSGSIVGTEFEAVSTAQADSGNIFRYSGGHYMFNLNTKGLPQGTYQVRVDLGDGATNTTIISLK